MNKFDWAMRVGSKISLKQNLLSLAKSIYASCQMLFCIFWKISLRESSHASTLNVNLIHYLKSRFSRTAQNPNKIWEKTSSLKMQKRVTDEHIENFNKNDRDDLRENIKRP